MKKKGKKLITCLMLVVVMALGACGAKGGENSKTGKSEEVKEELAPEYSYVAEYLSVPEGLDIYNPVFAQGAIYGQVYEYSPENGVGTYRLVRLRIAEGTLGEAEDLLTLEENDSVSQFCVDDGGNLYLLLRTLPAIPEDTVPDASFYENYYKNARYHLVKYDTRGEQVFDTDFTEQTKGTDYFYISAAAVDGEGNCCVCANQIGVILFGKDGEYLTTLLSDSWTMGIGRAKDGNLYFAHVEYGGEGPKSTLQKIDFEKKQFGDERKDFLVMNDGEAVFEPGISKDLLVYDQTALYEYDLEKQELSKVLTWMDCDMDGSAVSAVSCDADGKLYAILRSMYSEGIELANMKKVRAEDIAKRETITIGVLYGDSGLSRSLVEFNKKNETYRATIKTYMDMNDWSDTSYQDAVANLINDIMSGNGPDLFDLNGMDIENLASKGVLEDLKPYMKKSAVIPENDILPGILRGATYGDVLAFVPSGFELSTMAGKKSVVGDRSGWTCGDMIELAKRYPDADLLEYGTRDMALEMMLILGKKHFIDTDKNECHFDTDDFKTVLRFANSFPEEPDYNGRMTPFRLQDDSLLITMADIYDFQEVQTVLAYFGDEEVTFIGYPTYDDGNGCIMTPTNCYGLSALSAHKEGAFAVLESILSANWEEEWNRFGFSSRISLFEKQKEEALKVEYVYDENGELLLDDNGEPIYAGGGTMSMSDENGEEWSYQTRPVSAEEVTLVEKLLDGATMVNLSMDNEMNRIISEEAASYFSGSKSVDEVASIIQNRVNLYLKENE